MGAAATRRWAESSIAAASQALEADGARRLRNESFFSAPQLKRDPLGRAQSFMLRTVSSLAILCALTAFPACGASDFPCGNTVTSSLPSPGGTRTAVLFERSCGAMTSRAGVGLSILEGGDSM